MEEIKIDTLEDFYLTYSTIMIDLIDEPTLDRTMKRVVIDLSKNKDLIVEKIQQKDEETKMMLGYNLFDWFLKKEHFLENDIVEKFYDNYKLAFSEEIYDECMYLRKVKRFHHSVTTKKDTITITVYSNSYAPKFHNMVNRATLKYEGDTLKLCYIESPFSHDKNYEVEIFKDINDIYDQIRKQNKDLKFSCNKRYKNQYKKAIQRKYLKGEILEK